MATRRKVKVMFIDSVAGIGESTSVDPDTGREVKHRNEYGLAPMYSFRVSEVAMIDSELAEKWVEAQICELAPADAAIQRPVLIP